MTSFRDYLAARRSDESSAATRARAAAAQGLLPKAVIGSLHGRSTASPFEVEKLSADEDGTPKKNVTDKDKKPKKAKKDD